MTRTTPRQRKNLAVAPSRRRTVTPSRALRGNPISTAEKTRLTGLFPAEPAVKQLEGTGKSLEKAVERAVRSISGETLVEDAPMENSNDLKGKALDLEWSLDTEQEATVQRRSTRIGQLTDTVLTTASSLGKRGRDALESGKNKLHDMKRSLRTRDADDGEPLPKRSRMSTAPPQPGRPSNSKMLPKTTAPPKKYWLTYGKYVGQDRSQDPRLKPAQLAKLKASRKDDEPPKENKSLPLPMYGGAYLLERSDWRNFQLPFNIYSPLPPGQPRPEAWRTTQINVFIGDAATEWKKMKPLPPSKCMCTLDTGCDEDCQNRFMFYECDSSNCSIGPDCTNRAFADLRERVKRGRKYDIGVEVVRTPEKGFGIRACRSFEANQIIMEYTGEIITQDECERRMIEEYNDSKVHLPMFTFQTANKSVLLSHDV